MPPIDLSFIPQPWAGILTAAIIFAGGVLTPRIIEWLQGMSRDSAGKAAAARKRSVMADADYKRALATADPKDDVQAQQLKAQALKDEQEALADADHFSRVASLLAVISGKNLKAPGPDRP